MPAPTLPIAVAASALSVDPRRAAELARGLGFTGLQFPAVTGDLDLTKLSGTGRREFRHVLTAQNQQLVGLSVELGVKGFGPGADLDRLLDRFDAILEAAKGLMAPLVCCDIGPLPSAPREAAPRPKVTPEMAGLLILPTFSLTAGVTSATDAPPAARSAADLQFEAQIGAAMVELGRRADRYGVTVAFRTDLAEFAAIERALGAARCPWFGIDLDPAGILRDEWGADEIFSRLGPLIRHVRGRDAVGGSGGRTKPAVIGQGSTDWSAFLSRLDEAGYHGWITIDPIELPDRPAAAAAGVKWITKAGS